MTGGCPEAARKGVRMVRGRVHPVSDTHAGGAARVRVGPQTLQGVAGHLRTGAGRRVVAAELRALYSCRQNRSDGRARETASETLGISGAICLSWRWEACRSLTVSLDGSQFCAKIR